MQLLADCAPRACLGPKPREGEDRKHLVQMPKPSIKWVHTLKVT